ncbi:MAG: phosphoribosyl-ATP pyrophosphatase, partial [Spirochaetia bacterium]|nr:phosphoribosyl-ATP pyrophosphatase [Spirochaetia bacterium]
MEHVLKERRAKLPERSYTANLFKEGPDRILKKIVEEA